MALFFRDMSEAVVLAGSSSQNGVRDGVGLHARFTYPQNLCVNSRSAFVWSYDYEREQTRVTSTDLTTLKCETLNVIGVDEESDWILYAASDTELFALDPGLDWHKDKRFTLYRARIPSAEVIDPATMCSAVRSLDWQKPLEQVTFKLASGDQLCVDQRFLLARSSHHNAMLTSGFSEASTKVIDLSHDKDVTKEALQVLLNFIHADVWVGPVEESFHLTLQVWKLADKYQFPELVRLAEERLYKQVSHRTVLDVLTALDSSCSTSGDLCWIEDWCWRVLDRDITKVLPQAEADLDEIICKHPKLAKKMLQHLALQTRQARSSCRARPY